MIGGFDDVMARGMDRGLPNGFLSSYSGRLPGVRLANEPNPGSSLPAPQPPATGGFDPGPVNPPPQLTPEQQLLNKGPKAVWDDWIARMGGELAAMPRETPTFGSWGYHFSVPGSDSEAPRPRPLPGFPDTDETGFGGGRYRGGGAGFKALALM